MQESAVLLFKTSRKIPIGMIIKIVLVMIPKIHIRFLFAYCQYLPDPLNPVPNMLIAPGHDTEGCHGQDEDGEETERKRAKRLAHGRHGGLPIAAAMRRNDFSCVVIIFHDCLPVMIVGFRLRCRAHFTCGLVILTVCINVF